MSRGMPGICRVEAYMNNHVGSIMQENQGSTQDMKYSLFTRLNTQEFGVPGEFNLLEPHSGQVGGMVRHETVVWIKVVGTEKFMFLYTLTVHLSGQATTVQWLWTETQYLLIIFQNIFRQRERQRHAGGEGEYWGE